MAEKPAVKEKDVGQIIRYLTSTFGQATKGQETAFRNAKSGVANRQYVRERDFAYLINELTLGPRCVLQKNISDCNNFIDNTVQELNQEAA